MKEQARKEALIEALKKEKERFISGGHDTQEHDIAIHYLETGITNWNPERWELLDAAMHDYETLCADYEV